MLIADVPIWADCPFRNLVPKTIQIRRGDNEGLDTVVFWDEANDLNVCMSYEYLDTPRKFKPTVAGIVRSLRKAIKYQAKGEGFPASGMWI